MQEDSDIVEHVAEFFVEHIENLKKIEKIIEDRENKSVPHDPVPHDPLQIDPLQIDPMHLRVMANYVFVMLKGLPKRSANLWISDFESRISGASTAEEIRALVIVMAAASKPLQATDGSGFYTKFLLGKLTQPPGVSLDAREEVKLAAMDKIANSLGILWCNLHKYSSDINDNAEIKQAWIELWRKPSIISSSAKLKGFHTGLAILADKIPNVANELTRVFDHYSDTAKARPSNEPELKSVGMCLGVLCRRLEENDQSAVESSLRNFLSHENSLPALANLKYVMLALRSKDAQVLTAIWATAILKKLITTEKQKEQKDVRSEIIKTVCDAFVSLGDRLPQKTATLIKIEMVQQIFQTQVAADIRKLAAVLERLPYGASSEEQAGASESTWKRLQDHIYKLLDDNENAEDLAYRDLAYAVSHLLAAHRKAGEPEGDRWEHNFRKFCKILADRARDESVSGDFEKRMEGIGQLGDRLPIEVPAEILKRVEELFSEYSKHPGDEGNRFVVVNSLRYIWQRFGTRSEERAQSDRKRAMDLWLRAAKPLVDTSQCGLIGPLVREEDKEEVVDLLKWPTCSVKDRASLVDQLKRVYNGEGEEFRDIWSFVKWAKAKGLDPETPPKALSSPWAPQ